MPIGAHEAPPAIISVFLGDQLQDVIDQLCSTGEATHSIQGATLKTGVTTLPDFEIDATDRNRTSPFAFTNNKFEFRMVGSSDSIASPNIVLNTIVAESFKEVANELESASDFDEAVHDIIKRLFTAHRRIIFNGNGYSEEWVKEAKRRGLSNLPSMIDAIPALVSEDSIKLFEEFEVFTRTELESRVEIEYEAYSKAINIEAKTMIDIAGKSIIPAVIRYTTRLADSIIKLKSAISGIEPYAQNAILIEVNEHLKESKVALENLKIYMDNATEITDVTAHAKYMHEVVVPAMEALRKPIDTLEMIVDKDLWPMPSYGDLLFEV